MKRKLAALFAAVAIVSAAGIVSEQRALAQACPNGKKCNAAADCTYTCKRTYQGSNVPPRYYCHKVEAAASPGKNCGDGDKADNCADDKTVICGSQKSKECAGPPALPDCGAGTDTQNATEPGCT